MYFGKSYSFSLLCVNVYQFFVCHSFPFGFEDGLRDLLVLIPDHCLNFYLLWTLIGYVVLIRNVQ